jgi:hypothetical protein
MCRDGNFMTNGALKTGNLNELDARGKSNSKAKLLLSENCFPRQSARPKWIKVGIKVPKESR